MNKEYIFSNLDEISVEKDRISQKFEEGKWGIVPYETGKCRGKMLAAPETVFPKNVTLKLGLSGVYRIYICIQELRSRNYLYVKLSDDLCFTGVGQARRKPYDWGTEEFVEEVYWKTADLTGQDLIIGKPNSNFDAVTNLLWIRCVPADEQELHETVNNKCMQFHIDQDAAAEDSFATDSDRLIKLYSLKNANGDFVSMEFSFDLDPIPDPGNVHPWRKDERWDQGNYEFLARKEIHYQNYVNFAHENGLEIYATNRMEMANFIFPYSKSGWSIGFVDKNPQFYLENRNGVKTKICSYAYPEVQDFVINSFLKMLPYGFDGVSLILHRGMLIAFDAPVLERFHQLYPDLNPRLLPLSDPRLHGVLCEFMNAFMCRLRDALDTHSDRYIKINVITDYSIETAKNIGFDLEYWAKNKLVDSISQSDMEIIEDLENCMDSENPQLIDMDKYNTELGKRTVVRRNYGTNVPKICAHIPAFADLKKRYGVEVYHVLPWVHSVLPEDYAGIIEKMRDAGAEKFLSWNTNHLVWDLPEWYTVSHIGNPCDKELMHRQFYRVLSIDGCDISQFYPNWRG